jgi:hypothetical protein
MNRRPSAPMTPGKLCYILTTISIAEFFCAITIPGDPQLGDDTTGLFLFVLFISFGTGFLAWKAWLAHKKNK